MTDHMFEYLDAYHDGELNPGQTQKVERHLKECPTCQEAYLALQAVSAALREAPLPEFLSAEKMANDVLLSLPRKQALPLRRKALAIGWWTIPIGLFAIWVFIGSTNLVSQIIRTADDFGLLNSGSINLIFEPPDALNFADLLVESGFLRPAEIPWLAASLNALQLFLFNTFWYVSIAILYLSWIAIWWTQHTQQISGQSLER